MLTLTREQGQCIYVGRRLSLNDLEGTCDYRIDFDAVDHRIASRRIDVTIISEDDVVKHTLTPDDPDLDFAADCRLAFLSSHEYLDGQTIKAVARVGIKAPRYIRISRDNARGGPL